MAFVAAKHVTWLLNNNKKTTIYNIIYCVQGGDGGESYLQSAQDQPRKRETDARVRKNGQRRMYPTMIIFSITRVRRIAKVTNQPHQHTAQHDNYTEVPLCLHTVRA